MNALKLNHSYKIFTPLKVCSLIITILFALLFWQFALLARKSDVITHLLSENADLKKNLSVIDGQLLELEDAASDVRVFQRELVKVIKGIDQSYPVSFAEKLTRKASVQFDGDVHFDTETMLSNATESIFRLSSTHESLRFESANLLGRAISIRDTLEQTPSMFPVSNGYISSGFGSRIDPFTHQPKTHHGLDFAAPIGTPVLASAQGLIKESGRNLYLGNYVRVDHGSGFVTVYGHMSKTLVKPGQQVERGQEIGKVGNTGLRCRGAHLHFEVIKNGRKLNPRPYLINLPPIFS